VKVRATFKNAIFHHLKLQVLKLLKTFLNHLLWLNQFLKCDLLLDLDYLHH